MGIFKPGRPSTQDPPKRPGLYRFINLATGIIDYIGETNDLARRKQQHLRADSPLSDETHTFAWQKADGRSSSRTRREHEKRQIAKHDPPLNRNGGGGGRTAKRRRKKK